MNNKIINKLKLNKGESIAESLIALIIASLGMIILAGAITSSMKVFQGGRDLEAVYAKTSSSSTLPDQESVNVGGVTFNVTLTTNDNKRLYFYEEVKTNY